MSVQNIRFKYDISTLTFSLKQEEYPVFEGNVQLLFSATHDLYARCTHNGKKSSAVLCKNLSVVKLIHAFGNLGKLSNTEIVLEFISKHTKHDVYHMIALLMLCDEIRPSDWELSPEDVFKRLIPQQSPKMKKKIAELISDWKQYGDDYWLSEIYDCSNYFPLHIIDESKQKLVCIEPGSGISDGDSSCWFYNDLLTDMDEDGEYVISNSLLKTLCRNPKCIQRHLSATCDPGCPDECGRLVDISMILAGCVENDDE
jgi:hypothetical protein